MPSQNASSGIPVSGSIGAGSTRGSSPRCEDKIKRHQRPVFRKLASSNWKGAIGSVTHPESPLPQLLGRVDRGIVRAFWPPRSRDWLDFGLAGGRFLAGVERKDKLLRELSHARDLVVSHPAEFKGL